jgi:hypothetical protein
MHYWLKVQRRRKRTDSFQDAMALISHGFPQPEFHRFYGIIGSCLHPYLSNYLLHIKTLLGSVFHLEGLNQATLITTARLAIEAYDIFVGSVRDVQGEWLNESLLSKLFHLTEVPLSLWFLAVATLAWDIGKKLHPSKDIFLDLKDIRFAEKSWEEQFRLLERSNEVRLSSRLLLNPVLIIYQPLQAIDCHAFWSTTHDEIMALLREDGTIPDSITATAVLSTAPSTIEAGTAAASATCTSSTEFRSRQPRISDFEFIRPVVSERVVGGRRISSSIMRLGGSALKFN